MYIGGANTGGSPSGLIQAANQLSSQQINDQTQSEKQQYHKFCQIKYREIVTLYPQLLADSDQIAAMIAQEWQQQLRLQKGIIDDSQGAQRNGIHQNGIIGQASSNGSSIYDFSKRDNNSSLPKQMPLISNHRANVRKTNSPFIYFVQENRSKILMENPGKTTAEISTLMSSMWQSLTPEQKQRYQVQADIQKTASPQSNGATSLVQNPEEQKKGRRKYNKQPVSIAGVDSSLIQIIQSHALQINQLTQMVQQHTSLIQLICANQQQQLQNSSYLAGQNPEVKQGMDQIPFDFQYPSTSKLEKIQNAQLNKNALVTSTQSNQAADIPQDSKCPQVIVQSAPLKSPLEQMMMHFQSNSISSGDSGESIPLHPKRKISSLQAYCNQHHVSLQDAIVGNTAKSQKSSTFMESVASTNTHSITPDLKSTQEKLMNQIEEQKEAQEGDKFSDTVVGKFLQANANSKCETNHESNEHVPNDVDMAQDDEANEPKESSQISKDISQNYQDVEQNLELENKQSHRISNEVSPGNSHSSQKALDLVDNDIEEGEIVDDSQSKAKEARESIEKEQLELDSGSSELSDQEMQVEKEPDNICQESKEAHQETQKTESSTGNTKHLNQSQAENEHQMHEVMEIVAEQSPSSQSKQSSVVPSQMNIQTQRLPQLVNFQLSLKLC
ncbi:hypothetical protein FGO68_gene11130 [Halteria grandinella]|uniref:HMG box domain-containing protein n=1 Tax=Halteria grandinella TaxID=5974 RepID=A0A8J8NWD2_HALGN|nr:hypothetical protein FGO68_gene11130 [Halteria grandinella]